MEAFLRGNRFPASKAAEYGLISRAVPEADLDAALDEVLADLRLGGPTALGEAKRLLGARFDDPRNIWLIYSDGPGNKGRGGNGVACLPEDDLLAADGQQMSTMPPDAASSESGGGAQGGDRPNGSRGGRRRRRRSRSAGLRPRRRCRRSRHRCCCRSRRPG